MRTWDGTTAQRHDYEAFYSQEKHCNAFLRSGESRLSGRLKVRAGRKWEREQALGTEGESKKHRKRGTNISNMGPSCGCRDGGKAQGQGRKGVPGAATAARLHGYTAAFA